MNRPFRTTFLATLAAAGSLGATWGFAGCGESAGDTSGEDFDTGIQQQLTRDSGSNVEDAGAADVVVIPECVGLCPTQLSVGGDHSCAVYSDNTLRCWGNNGFGQTGQATVTHVDKPTVVSIDPVRQVATGGFHTCALLVSGGVACFGYNTDGELGTKATSGPHPKANIVTGFPANNPILQIQAGTFHTCVRLTQGQVMCWGYNFLGQIGYGKADAGEISPKAVESPQPATGVSNARDLTVGGSTNCVLKPTGIECFGSNAWGQLGRGSMTPNFDLNPAPLPSFAAGIRSFSANSGYHFAIVLQDGTVQAWGSNQDGELGTGKTGPSNPTPAPVANLVGVESVAAGGNTSCAVMFDHTVRCWGRNNSGQAAQLPMTDVLTPQVVTGLTNITHVGVSVTSFSCSLARDGVIQCWGLNDYGQLGRGTTGTPTEKPAPVKM